MSFDEPDREGKGGVVRGDSRISLPGKEKKEKGRGDKLSFEKRRSVRKGRGWNEPPRNGEEEKTRSPPNGEKKSEFQVRGY